MALSRIDVANMLTGTAPVANGGTGVTTAAALANTGNLVLLEEHIADDTISEVVVDNTQVTDTYETYLVIFTGVQMSSDNVDLWLNVSSDNGSNYKTSFDRCVPFSLSSDSNNGNVTKKTGTQSVINLTGNSSTLGNSGREAVSGQIYLYGLRDSGVDKHFWKHSVYKNTSNNSIFNFGMNQLNSADVINNFKVYSSSASATFSKGKISIYGIK
tara:strand:+ start:25 stop:666 length:642 start_codon:yes stop_codon:yes gene_type:complete